MNKLTSLTLITAALGIILTGCAVYEYNDRGQRAEDHIVNGTNVCMILDNGIKIHANSHWTDKRIEGLTAKVSTPGGRTLDLSVESYNASVNSNLVAMVDKSLTGLAANLEKATALVNAIEGGGVSSATSSLLGSLLTDAQTYLSSGKTNEAAAAISSIQAAVAALRSSGTNCVGCTPVK